MDFVPHKQDTKRENITLISTCLVENGNSDIIVSFLSKLRLEMGHTVQVSKLTYSC